MKRILLSLVILICIVSFVAPALAMKNEPEGFRGIPWGTPAPHEKDIFGRNKWGLVRSPMSPLSQTAYERKNDELSINGAKVISIQYIFQESLGFSRVDIFFIGLENYQLIRKAVLFNWGNPDVAYINYAGKPDVEKKIITGDEKEDYSYEEVSYWWWGKKVIMKLNHSNHGKHISGLEIFLVDFYDAINKDDAKYFQEKSGF